MGAVDTTYTFTATDTITSTKMNNIIDQTTITTDAIIGNTLEVATGKLKVRAAGITSNELATNAVTTAAITAGAVTPAKLSSGGPSWSGTGAAGVFTVPQTGLEFGTGHTQDYNCFIDLHTAATPTDYETRIVRDGGANGSFKVLNNGTGAIQLSSTGGVTFGTANMPNPSGTAPVYGIRAWVVFDANRNAAGTADTTNTTRFLIASGNVTSVTKTATGKYTVLFTTALSDANYSYIASAQADGSNEPLVYRPNAGTKSTTQFQVETQTRGGSLRDFNEVCISFLR